MPGVPKKDILDSRPNKITSPVITAEHVSLLQMKEKWALGFHIGFMGLISTQHGPSRKIYNPTMWA